MHSVILITGKVKYQINLDPTIWIIDDRHFNLNEYFSEVEGLAMMFETFLHNADPDPAATHVICHRSRGESITLTIEEAYKSYLCFAKEGQPLQEGGPIHLYLADGRNKQNPIDYIIKFEVVIHH
ncbi:hypothetical protein [Thermoflavimicrobium daqui]|jgi:hypothetical protein|uniref:Uncharacterized protein n=1 Tax=Thermoflavimicrobium daqui TaxID=2137476 RepID=A0A364K657_9BACL|nr:hypothetical protein [Thermoflavimicrobium daqui]RAL25670.1 hypothetical protein DL897_06215 [Thermoflavimicrobium daqui]